MRAKFTQPFKIQAVEKALSRASGVTLKEVSVSLGIGYSTLGKWLIESRNHEFESIETSEKKPMTNEKRPQDWSMEERLNMVIACASLGDDALNQYCREKGVYAHHVKQWKKDFSKDNSESTNAKNSQQIKSLNAENKLLKKELNRKERALAETAALLVLQKKVTSIWGSDEDNL